MRKTIWRRPLKEESKPINLTIHTKVPEKWIFVDTETPGIWIYSGFKEEGKMFRKASFEEIMESQEVANRLIAKLSGSNSI